MYSNNKQLKEKFGDSFWIAGFEFYYKNKKPHILKPTKVLCVEDCYGTLKIPYTQIYKLKSNGQRGKLLNLILSMHKISYFKSEEDCKNWFKEHVRLTLIQRKENLKDILEKEYQDHVKRYLGE